LEIGLEGSGSEGQRVGSGGTSGGKQVTEEGPSRPGMVMVMSTEIVAEREATGETEGREEEQ
jgi:hypothetical protein